MRRGLLLLFIVSFLNAGCAKTRHSSRWPAHIRGIEGFEVNEESIIRESLQNFEERTGQGLIQSDEASTRWTIYIIKKAPPQDKPMRAGLAIVGSEGCTIEISPKVFDEYHTYVKSVIWHEMGHCGGLEHTERTGDIMYRTTERFDRYSPESISRFFEYFLSQTKAE